MTHVRVATSLNAPPDRVWADVRDLASHVEWMQDAVEISFTSSSREGVGTSFRCRTKVGPFVLNDHMTVTDWREGHTIAIRHEGLVTGCGRFTLRRLGPRRTVFTWDEQLHVPWQLGGPLGGIIAGHVLRRTWTHNLANLSARFA